MSEKEIITQIDEILNSIKENLVRRKNRNWINSPISVFLEEVIFSMQVDITKKGFILKYTCKGDQVVASSKNVTHLNHCLWEILSYLELYEAKGGLLPVHRELQDLKQEFKNLLQLISPDENIYNICLVI